MDKRPCFYEEVITEIKKFLSSGSELPGNERALQMRLALFLAKRNKWHIDLEYYLPGDELSESGYMKEWGSKLYLDIVVSNDSEYLPIELKYKTLAIQLKNPLIRFEKPTKEKTLLTNQNAQDEGRYDFWRDVRRLQLICNHFDKIEHGIAVFVTNDSKYRNDAAKGTTSEAFSMREPIEEKSGVELKWHPAKKGKNENVGNVKSRPSRPDFEIGKVSKNDIEWLGKDEVSFTVNNDFLKNIVDGQKSTTFDCCIAVV